MVELNPQTITLIIAGIAALPGILSIIWQIRKDNVLKQSILADAELKQSERAENTVDTALSLVTPLKERILELEKELKKLSGELRNIEGLLKEKDKRISDLEYRQAELLKTISNLKEEIRVLKVLLSKFTNINELPDTPV